MTHWFFSYSRQELYYAEFAVFALQKAEFEIWLDLQQLEPGCNWQEEIDKGLENCGGVILLASRAALESQWVAHEWTRALEQGKPVYVLLFEAVDLTPEVSHLLEKAAAIIDGRRDFEGSMKRLQQSLRGENLHHDPIPRPNRLRIPEVVPLEIGFVWAALAALTILTAIVTLTSFSVYPLMTLAGVIVTAVFANLTWNVIHRQSYSSARAILTIAPLLAAIFVPLAVPFFLLATYLILFSPDIHRWSPLGQGMLRRGALPETRDLMDDPLYLEPNLFTQIVLFYTHSMWLARIVLALIALGIAALIPFGIVVLALVVLLGYRTVRKHRKQVQQAEEARKLIAENTRLTYNISAAAQDIEIGYQVRDAMNRFGHKGISGEDIRWNGAVPDYTIVILSNFSDPKAVEKLLVKAHASTASSLETAADQKMEQAPTASLVDGEMRPTIPLPPEEKADTSSDPVPGDADKPKRSRIVVVVASNLDNPEEFQSLSHFQWVDYRRQQGERLDSMARDLLTAGPDRVTQSFSTRMAPQNFRKILLPRKTAFYMGTQFFFFNLGIAFYVRNLSTGTSLDFMGRAFSWSDVALLALGIGGIIYSLWIGNRIIRREISTDNLLSRLLTFSILNYTVGFVIGLMIPLPYGYERDWGKVLINIVFLAIGLAIGFWIGRVYLNWILKAWLPTGYSPEAHPFPGFRRDWPLWRRNFISALLVGLFTFSFLSNEMVLATPEVTADTAQYGRVEIDGKMSLEIPQQWLQFNDVPETDIKLLTRSVPVAAALQRASGPLNLEIAEFLNDTLGGSAGGDARISSEISRMRNYSNFNWNNLGKQRFVAVYESRQNWNSLLVLGVWHFDPSADSGVSVSADIRNAVYSGSAAPTAHDALVLRYDLKRGGNEGVADEISVYDTPLDDYFLVVTGSQGVIDDQQAVIQHIIESAQFELPAGLTLTPTATITPTLTPTLTPTPKPSLTPTITPTFRPTWTPMPSATPRERMTLRFNGVTFKEPEGWNAAIIEGRNLSSAQWSMPDAETYYPSIVAEDWLGKSNGTLRGEWLAFPGDAVSGFPLVIFAGLTSDENVDDWIERTISEQYSDSETEVDEVLPNGLHRRVITYYDSFGTMTEIWLVSIDTPQADYVIWVYGYKSEVTAYESALMAWLRSIG